MTEDKKLESNYENLLYCCRGYAINLDIFMGIVNQEISWMEDCIKSFLQGAHDAKEGIVESRKLIDAMLPVVETIINTEDKSTLFQRPLPKIEANTVYMNYKINSSVIGMYMYMVHSVRALEICNADESCTCKERQDAQAKIKQNENNTKEKYNVTKARYDKICVKADLITSGSSNRDTMNNDGK